MTLIFDAPFGINGIPGGGGSIDESRIIVKSATIPTAGEDNVGFVYQYVGETDATYTHGYIYECKQQVTNTITFTPATMSVSGTDFMAFLASVASGADYENIVKGTFTYLASGDVWKFVGKDAEDNTVLTYQQYTVDFENAGFTMPTDPQDGDVVEFVRTVSNTYAWERIDVQPGATRGRFLALWNCATGLAESNPPTSPYLYGTGDYYIVGTVGTTNYKPSGTQYVIGTASTTVETEDVAVNDTYYYDGTNWNLQKNTGTTYTAGTGISISNGTISVADPTLTNTAISPSALTIDGSPAGFPNTINIGSNSSATGTYNTVIGNSSYSSANYGTVLGYYSGVTGIRGVAVGYDSIAARDSVAIGSISEASANYSTAIGENTKATAQNAFALGTSAQATAQGAIQIGGRTNSEPYTLYCGQYGYTNWKLLDLKTGKIPSERLDVNEAASVTNQNENVGAVTPLKVWEGTSAQYTSDAPVTTNYYGWLNESVEDPLITNTETPQIGDICYYGHWGSVGPFSIIDTDGSTYITIDQAEPAARNTTFDYSVTIGGYDNKTLCFVEGVGIKRNGIDIASLSNYTAGTGIDITDGVISGTDYVEVANFTRDLTDTSIVKMVPFTSGYTFPKDKIYVMTLVIRQDPVGGEPTPIADNTPITIQDGNGRKIYFMLGDDEATTFKDIKALLRPWVNPSNKRIMYRGNILGRLAGVESPYGLNFVVCTADNNPADMQTTTNLVTSVSSASTDTQYPSAKLFYDTVGNIEATLDAIIAQGSNS